MARTIRYANLGAYLKASGVSQEVLAHRVGCTQSMLSRIAAGKAMPSFSLALRIAKVASIPVESLAPAADDSRSHVVGL